jgi:nucleoside-diphosphate-sugar epimerase
VEYAGADGKLHESSALEPRTLYGASKAALGMIGAELSRRHGWSFAQARVFNVYGPGEDERRLVPHVISSLLRGVPCELTAGTQVRDYMHVDDVARGLVALAESGLEGPVNVASSEPVTVAQVARTIAAVGGGGELLRFGARQPRATDHPCVVADSTLLSRIAEWSPKYRLDAGIHHTAAWWREVLAGGRSPAKTAVQRHAACMYSSEVSRS